jgi:aminopeptidase N
MTLEEEDFVRLALEQLKTADNMTDALAALALLAESPHPARDEALMHFYELWREYPLVIDKWLRVQAVSRLPNTVDKIKRLSQHECYQDNNPNKVHALIGAFSHANPLRFHQSDGSGYQLVVEQLLATDSKNPQVAARLASAFNLWRRFEPGRRDLMQKALERIHAQKGLSRDVGEIIDRALAD